MMKELIIGFRSSLILWILTALIYPFFLIFIGQTFLPYTANGSIIQNEQAQVIGSELIGQNFSTAKYFLSRPSTINYSEGENAGSTGISGASNLAPSNPDLINRIKQSISELNQKGITPTASLVYASGSGLDPHITPAAAQAQITTVAAARAKSPETLEQLVKEYTENRFLGIFGEPRVNVLKLNLALEQLN